MEVVVELTVLGPQVDDGAAGMHDSCMIAATKGVANLGQAVRRKLARQPHGDLARSCDGTRALLRMHLGDLDAKVVGNRLLDEFDGDLPVMGANNILERFLGNIDIEFAALKVGKGDNLFQCAFEFAHVGAQVLGDQERHIVTEIDLLGFGFLLQNGDTHFEFRRLDLYGKAGAKTRN